MPALALPGWLRAAASLGLRGLPGLILGLGLLGPMPLPASAADNARPTVPQVHLAQRPGRVVLGVRLPAGLSPDAPPPAPQVAQPTAPAATTTHTVTLAWPWPVPAQWPDAAAVALHSAQAPVRSLQHDPASGELRLTLSQPLTWAWQRRADGWWLEGRRFTTAPRSASASSPPAEWLLQTRLNGQALPGLLSASEADGRLWLGAEDWRSAGLRPPADTADTASEGRPAHALDTIPGAAWLLEPGLQRLTAVVPPAALIRHSAGSSTAAAVIPPSRPGVILSHESGVRREPAGWSAFSALDLLAFGSLGSLSHSQLLRRDADGRWHTQRLATTWQYDQPEQLRSWTAGDMLSVAGAWGAVVRHAGVRVASDFALQPGQPLGVPLLWSGSTTLPATLEWREDGQLRMTRQLAPGSFEDRLQPSVNGATELRLNVRDALGREQVVVQQIYASPTLLAPGLVAWAAEAGRLDSSGGTVPGGDHFVAALWRQGLTRHLSGEWRAELQGDRQAIGTDLAYTLGALAAGRITVARSRGQPGGGGLYRAASLERIEPANGRGVYVQWSQSDAGYSTLGQVQPAGGDLQRLGAGVQGRIGPVGASLAWMRARLDGQPTRHWLSLQTGTNLAAGWRAQALLQWQHGDSSDWRAWLTLQYDLGRSQRMVATTTRGAEGHLLQTSWQHDAPMGPGQGWMLQASHDGIQPRLRAAHSLNATAWQLRSDLDASTYGTRAGVSLASSVGWVDGLAFASRRVSGASMALVHVEGVPGLPVLRHGEPVGMTNSQGMALVSQLVPWQANQLAVDPTDTPLDVELQGTVQTLWPRARGAVRMEVRMRRLRDLLLTLHQLNGRPVPRDARIDIDGLAGQPRVMLDGEVYLSERPPQPLFALRARWPGGACSAQVAVPADLDPGVRLGPITCVAQPE